MVKERTKTPRESDLPGMENRKIQTLERLASEYADIRDNRMELNQSEAELKAKLLAEMRRLGKQIYKHGSVEIRIVKGEDDVKVKIAKTDTDTAVDETPESGEDAPELEKAPPPPPEFDDPRDVPPAPREEPAAPESEPPASSAPIH